MQKEIAEAGKIDSFRENVKEKNNMHNPFAVRTLKEIRFE